MLAPRTTQSLRQAVYSKLTVPVISYYVNAAGPFDLTADNVFEKEHLWSQGADPISPLIEYSVSSGKLTSRVLPFERELLVKIWISSTLGSDEVVEIYEAVQARFSFADQDAVAPATDTSRLATAGTLPLIVREFRDRVVLPVAYEEKSARWYISASYDVRAL